MIRIISFTFSFPLHFCPISPPFQPLFPIFFSTSPHQVVSEGEHPVSAKFRGLRNRFVRWWVLEAPHEQPIFTSVFGKNVIFQVQIAFQLRFSCVSAVFQLRFSYVSAHLRCVCFFISILLVPKYPRSWKSNFWSDFLCVSAAFQLAKTGAHPLVVLHLHCICIALNIRLAWAWCHLGLGLEWGWH